MVPMGAVIVSLLIGKTKIPPIYFLFAGSILEVIGTAGLSQTPAHHKIWKLSYLFQFLAGAGVGCFNGTLTLISPFTFEKRDLGVGTASVAQFKVLGGMAVLAITTSVMDRWVRRQLLQTTLPLETVELLLQTTDVIDKLSESDKAIVRNIFGRGYNLSMKIMIGMGAANFPSTLLMWTKKPIQVIKK